MSMIVGVLGEDGDTRERIQRTAESAAGVRVAFTAPLSHRRSLPRTGSPHLLVTLHRDAHLALRELRAAAQATPVPTLLVLNEPCTEDDVSRLLLHGARGIVGTASVESHLPWAVHAAAAGGLALAPTATETLLRWCSLSSSYHEESARAHHRLQQLTSRERDVLAMLSTGASTPEIGTALRLSPHTVKDHVQAIYAKLDVTNRIQAARVEWQQHLPAAEAPGK
ncbi:helix-turn-helix transcriptional regulator [Streptomyces triticagri]|nr:LuxR C-terminal-related transcriptional regulator [Streptomyces triticagri]